VRQMKILTRASSRNGNSNDAKPNSPYQPSVQTPPVRLMKRERRPVIVSDAPIVKPPSPPLESETLNQRAQAYALARARIFNEPLDQSLGQASLEEDVTPVQVTSAIPQASKETILPQESIPSASVVQPVITPHQTLPNTGHVANTSPALGVTESGYTYPPPWKGEPSGWTPLSGRPSFSAPFFEFQPSYSAVPSHETNYAPHQPPRHNYSQQPLQGQYHPSQSGVHPSMYHPQPPTYQYASDMRHDPYANRRTPPPPSHQGLMYDYSDMNSIPGPTEREVHLPKHIVELSNLPSDLRSLDDPRLNAFQGHDASIRILSHAKSPDSSAVMVAVFKSNSSAARAIQHITCPYFQLIPWTGKME